MATFKVVLDTRKKLKDGQYNLAVRVCDGKEVLYLNVVKMSKEDYNILSNKKSHDDNSTLFKNKCIEYEDKCRAVYNTIGKFDREKIRDGFYNRMVIQENGSTQVTTSITSDNCNSINHSLLLRDLFNQYIEENNIKPKTRNQMMTSRNLFETFRPNSLITDVNIEFLKSFEKFKKQDNVSDATISSHCRNLRSIINYNTKFKKIVPKEYEYPFGRWGYIISSYFPNKKVISEAEIKKIIAIKSFESPSQEFARDIWLFLYRANGINFIDLLKMRWDNVNGNIITITRTKTETTRKNNKKYIVIPIDHKLQGLIEKWGDKQSLFLMGLMEPNLSQSSIEYRSDKLKRRINYELRKIGIKLNLSISLNLSTARDAYATTLKRNGVPTNAISEMLGHSNSIVTEHYLGSFDAEKTFDVNQHIL